MNSNVRNRLKYWQGYLGMTSVVSEYVKMDIDPHSGTLGMEYDLGGFQNRKIK